MQILSTKLFVPPLRSRLVVRPRLFQKLNQGAECGFVLVSAPAGYGKSTMLSAWLNHLGYPAAWYSLDNGDNDPLRFLAYLSAALRKVDPSVGDLFASITQSAALPEVETLLIPLVNHLAQRKGPFWLVLDDYHLIQNQVIHQVIGFLLEHRPAALHLVIATRADPPLPLNRLRARSEMVELRLAELRFTLQEAADFFNQTMGVQVSPEDLVQITKRTEGWIAGLQIAALSMQNADDIPGFIRAFTGSHHPVFDYLMEEILRLQSPDIRRFLLSTSLLDQFTASLCDALFLEEAGSVPLRSSSAILDELEHANLFILPLDLERRWYRYHPLFADLLRASLQQSQPERVPVLHERASAWSEGQGYYADAIRHALAAGDWERVVRLVSANVFALLDQNELSSVARQLENLAGEKSLARPWLWIGRAWLAAYTGQLRSVENSLGLAEVELDTIRSEPDRQTLRGQIAAIRAFAAWMVGSREAANRSARLALEYLPETETLIRCLSATLLGLNFDDMDTRARAYQQALAYSQQAGVSHVTIFAHGCWAYLLILQGRLREAYSACQEAIQFAGSSTTPQPLPSLSYIYTNLSLILLEWNRLEESLGYARQAVDLARRWEQADALHFAYTNLASTLYAVGDITGALDALLQSWQIAHHTSPWFEEITVSMGVELHLAQDDLEAALQYLRLAQIDIEDLNRVSYSSLLPRAIAQVYLYQKQYSKALELLASDIAGLEKKKIVSFLVSTLAWQALAYHKQGQETQALASLKRALTLAAPEGYMRSFLIAGAALVPLLQKARLAGIIPEYVDKLLASAGQGGKHASARAEHVPGLVEQLSEREMEVLKLLAQGCPDKQIAESLVIARETVHKHLKNIYGKLDVHSRTEALARARGLGLL